MKKVLIIEDDEVIANIYRNKLVVDGFQVEIARDGQAGLDMLQSFDPDLVLLDLVLPAVPGLEVMKTIRAEPKLKQIPVIVFSNTYLTNMIQDAWKAGATKCLSKAICTPRQVIEVVRNSLKANGTSSKSPGDTNFFISTPKKGALPPAVPEAPVPFPDELPAGADAEFQSELRHSFLTSLPGVLTALRASLQGVVKADSEKVRLKQLHEIYRRTHALTGNAALTGMTYIAQMSDALEALTKELHDNPKSINASTVRTVASAIDFLGILFDRGPLPDKEFQQARALIVDDEDIAIKAISYALDKAKLKSIGMTDPLRAFDMLLENKYDLIVLDVGMPKMDGFEFCSKVRSLVNYKKTPVIFVTSLTDFETRANSTVSGGNDFIAKPFLFIELATKAVVHVIRARLEPTRN